MYFGKWSIKYHPQRNSSLVRDEWLDLSWTTSCCLLFCLVCTIPINPPETNRQADRQRTEQLTSHKRLPQQLDFIEFELLKKPKEDTGSRLEVPNGYVPFTCYYYYYYDSPTGKSICNPIFHVIWYRNLIGISNESKQVRMKIFFETWNEGGFLLLSFKKNYLFLFEDFLVTERDAKHVIN